jgi:hypothetical protein
MTPPPDQPPPPGIDTSGKQPYDSGLLSRITAIHFPRRITARPFIGSTANKGYIGLSRSSGKSWGATKQPAKQGGEIQYDNPVFGVASNGAALSSGAKGGTIFVYAGLTYADPEFNPYYSDKTGVDISYSTNGGQTWAEANHLWFLSKFRETHEIYGLTFDDDSKMFYVSLFHLFGDAPPEGQYTEVIIGSSSDGINFSEHSTIRIQTGLEPGPPPFLVHLPGEGFDQRVVSKDTGTILENPSPPQLYFRNKLFNQGSASIIRTPGPFAKPGDAEIFGLSSVNSIAWSAGLWIVGGQGGIIRSEDDGITWLTTDFAFDDYVTGVAGL